MPAMDPFDATRKLNASAAETLPAYLKQLMELAATPGDAAEPEITFVSIPDTECDRPPSPACDDPAASARTSGGCLRGPVNELNTPGERPHPPREPERSPPSALSVEGGASPSSTASAAAPAPASSRPPPVSTSGWWYSLSDAHQARQIREIVGRIVDRFPPVAPATLVFVSADPSLSTNRTVGKIARALAECKRRPVLLVDANLAENGAHAASTPAARGLSEVWLQQADWKEMLIATEEPHLKVLSCGSAAMSGRDIPRPRLAELRSAWQREFTYVCINGGHVRQPLARSWAGCGDGTYVLVGLGQTTRKDAAEAARLLESCPARIIGSIVFDSADLA